jgi:hypothetical protein
MADAARQSAAPLGSATTRCAYESYMPPPRPKRSQDKKLREREDLIRRSLVLDSNSKILWIEIARGWAWDDKSCFPSQETLAAALGWSVRKVKRYLSILREKKLILISNKHGRGNRYKLPGRIPASICSPERLINKKLSQLGLGKNGGGTELAHRAKSGRPNSSPHRGQNWPLTGDRTVPPQGTELAPEDELKEDENSQEELSEGLRAASRSRPQDTEDSDDENPTKGGGTEVDGLIGETEEDISKGKPKKRAPRVRCTTSLPHLR